MVTFTYLKQLAKSSKYYSDFVVLYCMRCSCVIQLALFYPRNADQSALSQVSLLTAEHLPYGTYLMAMKPKDKWCECKSSRREHYKFFIPELWMPKSMTYKQTLPKRIIDLVYVRRRWIPDGP